MEELIKVMTCESIEKAPCDGILGPSIEQWIIRLQLSDDQRNIFRSADLVLTEEETGCIDDNDLRFYC